MSLFDTILGAAHNHPTVKNLADKLGIDQATAEKAIAGLAEAHTDEGDTIDVAASKTGIDAGVLSQVREAVGGEGSLGKFMQILDSDHDGNPLNDIAGFAGKLFGKK
ncbi:hypothetical protein ACXYN8_04795 [Altererythrobacter sp. CAU 1778]